MPADQETFIIEIALNLIWLLVKIQENSLSLHSTYINSVSKYCFSNKEISKRDAGYIGEMLGFGVYWTPIEN